MLCGRMTPDQTTIVRKRVKTDLDEYMDLLNYFIKELGHPGYSGIPMPKKFSCPLFVEDKESDNNTGRFVNRTVEFTVEGGTCYFYTAQDPSEKTSVYSDSKNIQWHCSTNPVQPY